MVRLVSRAVALWVLACVTLAARWLPAADFFRAGPGPGVVVFGAAVDTWLCSSRFARRAKEKPKYACLLGFCVVNSAVRTVYSESLAPWLVTRVQGSWGPSPLSGGGGPEPQALAYEVTVVHALYPWFDWLVSVNVLLVQADVLVVEAACNVVTSVLITRGYLARGVPGTVDRASRV
jgi:hypothetical protein